MTARGHDFFDCAAAAIRAGNITGCVGNQDDLFKLGFAVQTFKLIKWHDLLLFTIILKTMRRRDSFM